MRRMNTAGSIFGLALVAALGACARTGPQPGTASTGSSRMTASACPLAKIPGIHSTVADIHNGVAITFTAPQGEVSALRENVRAMNDANNKKGDAFAECACGRKGSMGSAESMPSSDGSSPMADSNVEEISTGAIITFTAKDEKQVSALRSTVRGNVRALRNQCMGGSNQSPTQMQSPSQSESK